MQKKGRKQHTDSLDNLGARNVMDFNKNWEREMKEVSLMVEVPMCIAVEILARVLGQVADQQEETEKQEVNAGRAAELRREPAGRQSGRLCTDSERNLLEAE